jgi:fructuronate reductase
MGVDDEGNTFELSPDPLLDSVCVYASKLALGSENDVEQDIRQLLEDEKIFGVNLYEVGMAKMVVGYLAEMLVGPGAIRATLKKYV